MNWSELLRTATWICAAATLGGAVGAFTRALVVAHRWAMAALAFWAVAIWWGMIRNLHVPVKGTTWLLLAGGVCGCVFFAKTFELSTGKRRPPKLTKAGRRAQERGTDGV